MSAGEIFVEFLKYVVPAAFVLGAVWVVMRELLRKQDQVANRELKAQAIAKILPLRLNAYERAILFLERISPENLIIRCDATQKNALTLHRQILAEIRSEYEHNMSQQLYISPEAWLELVKAKEFVLQLVNESSAEIRPEAPGMELGRKIFERMMKHQTSPCHKAILTLKKDIQKLFKI